MEELSKTELQAGSLECNLKLKKLSYWYKDVIQEINIEVDSTGKSYPFTYPYTYSNSISGKVSITNNDSLTKIYINKCPNIKGTTLDSYLTIMDNKNLIEIDLNNNNAISSLIRLKEVENNPGQILGKLF